MSEEKRVKLPADKTLTSENFLLNPDGTVTIKNEDLSSYLRDKINYSVSDTARSSEYVGVIWG